MMNQSNMDLIATVIVFFEGSGQPEIFSQNGRIAGVERRPGFPAGATLIHLQPGEGISPEALAFSLGLGGLPPVDGDDAYTSYLFPIFADPNFTTYLVTTLKGSGPGSVLADRDFSLMLWRKRPV